ncbi:16S rRNA (adenine(1518)-N(6)/adenine(1519)-N(6))-dimethyltransferase RsmA [Neisseria sp. Ec49-e6-T10]|uniref:16S rRNA (adenine(1518)-N(6)/adenine(1519)-N(6))- dimethyltransferase RsmA n=1 Tax=Neisseria sp. Ec49-e6-T10 TaxID=3140744 RepID=UPI003EBDC973
MSQHIARKRFGQNFLQDQKVIFDIVRAVQPTQNDTVIEIGPGLGALTTPLVAQINQLHVIEIDRNIITRLKQSEYAHKLIIHEGDVLKFDFKSIVGPKKLVGNLPYNISTPLLFHLAQLADEVVDMHFMLQKEVVERMVALPNSGDYGRLSVMLQYFFEMEYLFTVPPEAFDPPPKVKSAVVRMIPQQGRIGLASDFEFFQKIVAQAFSQRRKTIRNTLKGWADEAVLLLCQIDPTSRPENISPQQYVALSNLLCVQKSV